MANHMQKLKLDPSLLVASNQLWASILNNLDAGAANSNLVRFLLFFLHNYHVDSMCTSQFLGFRIQMCLVKIHVPFGIKNHGD